MAGYVSLQDVTKTYQMGEVTIKAADGISFDVEKGEFVIVVGPSGAGKTTVLNILGGMDTATSGKVLVDGAEISKYRGKKLIQYRREDIGFVFQFYNLIPDLTVCENIEVVSDISASPLDIDDIMKALEIDKYSYRFPKELSGGQQQRTAIGRALIKNPKLLLCDELTGALDSHSSKAVLRYIEKVNKQFGTTIIIITHNEQIRCMADRIIRIKDGQVALNEKNDNKLSVESIEL